MNKEIFDAEAQTYRSLLQGDAAKLPIADNSIDLIVTSPPYWNKRNYGFDGQIGQESNPQKYVENLIECLDEWFRVITSFGSIFLNIGDTYNQKSLSGIPARLEAAVCERGWIVRNRIIWTKPTGMPEPAKDRLANRYEFILHLVATENYYYDMFGYSEVYGNGTNPGDVWPMNLQPDGSRHLAPFPDELVERAILLASPKEVCEHCQAPRRRILERTPELDTSRPQARRAMELAEQYGLTNAHIRAIQATGISDAGKALRVQTGTGRNSEEVKRLAAEAKNVLGGYFREFTFAKKKTAAWTTCNCQAPYRPGRVLDPFVGTGTTLRAAARLGRSGIGVDKAPLEMKEVWGS